VRDALIDFVRYWSVRTGLAAILMVGWFGISQSKYHHWRHRYGKVNEHNCWIPRDWWLLDWEKEAIIGFARDHPVEGYRRLSYMMLDGGIVCASPTTVFRVLRDAGMLSRWPRSSSGKKTGFEQPMGPHEHWHVDISYVNIHSTFYYLISVLDGYSRFIVDWDIRERMTEADVEIVLERAKEKFPSARPRIITDNGGQFIAREFKQFIRISGMTHVRTSAGYPQSNGKIERWHSSVKSECIRVKTPITHEDGRRVVGEYVDHYNNMRLHSGIGYIAPADKLAGREADIFAERDRRLEEARAQRKSRRQQIRIAGVQADRVRLDAGEPETKPPSRKASDLLLHDQIVAEPDSRVQVGVAAGTP